jgi:hypothetical protein
VKIEATGKLTANDYKELIPALEGLAGERGPLRLYIELENFEGWTPSALWKDIEFDATHQDDMERVAIVGEGALEKWGVKLSKPFFKADVRFFPRERAEDAQEWLQA